MYEHTSILRPYRDPVTGRLMLRGAPNGAQRGVTKFYPYREMRVGHPYYGRLMARSSYGPPTAEGQHKILAFPYRDQALFNNDRLYFRTIDNDPYEVFPPDEPEVPMEPNEDGPECFDCTAAGHLATLQVNGWMQVIIYGGYGWHGEPGTEVYPDCPTGLETERGVFKYTEFCDIARANGLWFVPIECPPPPSTEYPVHAFLHKGYQATNIRGWKCCDWEGDGTLAVFWGIGGLTFDITLQVTGTEPNRVAWFKDIKLWMNGNMPDDWPRTSSSSLEIPYEDAEVDCAAHLYSAMGQKLVVKSDDVTYWKGYPPQVPDPDDDSTRVFNIARLPDIYVRFTGMHPVNTWMCGNDNRPEYLPNSGAAFTGCA